MKSLTGFRMTSLRRSLVDIFTEQHIPLSGERLLEMLEMRQIKAHRTSLYRELQFLLDQKIIHEVKLTGTKLRYELTARDHHHHVVCVKCDDIADVKLDEDIERQQKAIEQRTKFQILTHSLEFFGVCAKCQ